MGPKQNRFRLRFDWPGIVSVIDDATGELVARSLPGWPADPDDATVRLAADDKLNVV